MATLIAAQPKATGTMSARSTRLIVLALLALMAICLFASVRQESQTADEGDHIFSGFEYWKHGDFGRNPEHPPLVKLLATIPILPMGLQEPPPAPVPFFKMQDFLGGFKLLYSNDADAILIRCRMVIALFTLTLALLVFLAAQEMFGTLAGIIAISLCVFEPALLANGALVTTDMALTCLFFASVYSFYRYVKRPSLGRLALCALPTGMAIVAKHSGILVLPALILVAIASLLIVPDQSVSSEAAKQDQKRRLFQLAAALLAIFCFSDLFLWAIYHFRYAARPGGLEISPSLAEYAAGLTSPLKRSVILFLAQHHLFPEAYLYGWTDILLIPGTRSTFILGHNYASGRWFFFPAIFLIKSTLTLLIFLLLVPFARIRRFKLELAFLTLPVFFFVLASMSSMLNLGVRHILPIYPFCIILGAAAASSFAMRWRIAKVAVAALLLFAAVSSLHAFPDYLAYSNEIAGGPSHTYRLVADSNDDWGQGLKWTKKYLDQHPTSNCWTTAGVIFASDYYGIHCKPLLTSMGHLVGIPSAPIPPTISGTMFISPTEAVGIWWGPDVLNPYNDFLNRKPDAIIGNAVLVYNGTFNVPLLAAETNAVDAGNLLNQHRVPEALALAQAAAQEAPDTADVNAVLGQALIASHREAEGQQALAKANRIAATVHPDFQKLLLQKLPGLHFTPPSSTDSGKGGN